MTNLSILRQPYTAVCDVTRSALFQNYRAAHLGLVQKYYSTPPFNRRVLYLIKDFKDQRMYVLQILIKGILKVCIYSVLLHKK